MENKDIRKKLKDAGFKNAQISVREIGNENTTRYIITVNEPDISLLEIKELTGEYQVNVEEKKTKTVIKVERNEKHPVNTRDLIELVTKSLKKLLLEKINDRKNYPIDYRKKRYILEKGNNNQPELFGPKAVYFSLVNSGHMMQFMYINRFINPNEVIGEEHAKAVMAVALQIAESIRENELDLDYIEHRKNNKKQGKAE